MKAIIFDLQGTLIENGVFPSPIKQVKYILRIHNDFHEYITIFERSFMTKSYDSLNEGFNAVTREFKLNTPEFVIEKLVGLWNKNKLLSKPYHDTIEILTELKTKYKLILVVNIDCFTKDIIEKYELNKYFDIIMLSCEKGMLKSNPQFLLDPLEQLGIAKEDAVLVGDSIDSDIESAKRAGIKAILIDRNDTREFSPKVNNLRELVEYLDNNNGG